MLTRLIVLVRATHIPTGLAVLAREERSQYMNKKLSLARLVQKLEEKKFNSRVLKRQEQWAQHRELERGNPVKVFMGMDFREKHL